MNQTLTETDGVTEPLAAPAPATVLLAYRDAEHERLGKTFWQAVSRYLHCADRVRISEWKFEMIASSALNPLAKAEAREADLILLAAYCGESLPDKVRGWLEAWYAHQTRPGFLVVLLTENLAGSAIQWPEYPRLAVQARESGIELIVCPLGASADQRSGSIFTQSWRARAGGLVPLGDVPEVAALLGGSRSTPGALSMI